MSSARTAALLVWISSLAGCSTGAGSEPEPAVLPNASSRPGDEDAGSPPDAGVLLPAGGGDWAQYRFDAAGTWHNPGMVTVDQASRTALAWTAELGEYGWTQPVIAGDAVYATMGYSGKVFALDAASGAERWSRELNHVFTSACTAEEKHHGFYAAPSVNGDLVYAASPDGNLYALDVADGTTRWQMQVANPLNRAEFVQSSPSISIALGKVFLGVGASMKCDPVEGRVLWIDPGSKQTLERSFHSTGVTGASVWSSISVDEPAQRIYVTTGDPAGNPLDQVPYAQSFLSLNADTLEIVDHWQNPSPGPTDNSDFGGSPTLFESSDGRALVAAPNKDGWLYVLDRYDLAAGPVWKFQLAVGGDPMMGEGSIVSPTFAGGTLFASGGRTPHGEPGSVVALDPGTGAVKWKHVTPGFVIAATPAVGDILVVASSRVDYSESTLELLDLGSGNVVKAFTAPSASLAAPSVGRGLVLWLLFPGQLRAYRIPSN